MNIFQQIKSPQGHALVQTLLSVLAGAIVTGVSTGEQYLVNPATLNFRLAAILGVNAFIIALVIGLLNLLLAAKGPYASLFQVAVPMAEQQINNLDKQAVEAAVGTPAPVLPMAQPVNVAKLQTAQMPAVGPSAVDSSWMQGAK